VLPLFAKVLAVDNPVDGIGTEIRMDSLNASIEVRGWEGAFPQQVEDRVREDRVRRPACGARGVSGNRRPSDGGRTPAAVVDRRIAEPRG
jgi:hypothetical protein